MIRLHLSTGGKQSRSGNPTNPGTRARSIDKFVEIAREMNRTEWNKRIGLNSTGRWIKSETDMRWLIYRAARIVQFHNTTQIGSDDSFTKVNRTDL
jgi:hypothetical protein